MAQALPAWRKTGRKAKVEHYEGLQMGAFVEFVGYDDRGRQQGRILGCLAEVDELHVGDRGVTGLMHVLAIEDGYYEYWHEQTYGKYDRSLLTPVHFCEVAMSSCGVHTMYRSPLHVDVFRVVSLEEANLLAWLSDVHKSRIEGPSGTHPGGATGGEGLGPFAPAGVTGGVDAEGDRGGLAQTGAAGLQGLAKALGDGGRAEVERQAEREAQRLKKAERREERDNKPDGAEGQRAKESRGDRKRKVETEELMDELQARVPKGPRLSALDLDTHEKKGKKRRRKKRGRSAKRDESGSSDSSSSSSSGELFRGAALPRGMEKLRRVHQTYPGRIASRSLQRLQELLMNAQGRGTAFQEEENSQLPAVAVGYLSQVFFVQNPPQVVGMRSSKELRTIAHCIDLIARNDPLRALDVLVQRLKAIELAHLQSRAIGRKPPNWS